MKNCILSNIFFKSKQRKSKHRSDSDKGENRINVAAAVGKDVGVDFWSEILLNVDPYWIFKCILVSKEWLEVITSSCFRSKYLKKWKGCFPVIGFMHARCNRFMHACGNGNLQLVAANKLGSHIDKTKLVRGHCRFISKSISGDGLILCIDDHKNTMYVFNPASSGGSVLVTRLPSPPAVFKCPMMEIISFEDASFKVIMVARSSEKVTSLSIQTFCSSSWMWERLEVSCCDSFWLIGYSGIGSSRGVVYWPAMANSLVAYDTNSGHIRLISPAVKNIFTLSIFYDMVSPGSNLRCATVYIEGIIKIWWLNDVEEKFEWKLSYTVDTAYLWYDHWRELIPAKAKAKKNDDYSSPSHLFKYFDFISFVPGKPDSIFLARGYHLFVYDARIRQLNRFQVPVPSEPCTDIYRQHTNFKMFVPLTIAESGVWPSSLSSNHPMSPE